MQPDFSTISSAAQQMPEAQVRELATLLEERLLQVDSEYSTQWREEIARRQGLVAEGKANFVSFEELKRSLDSSDE